MDTKQIDVIPVQQFTSAVPATDNRLDRTRIATTADPALSQLRHHIFHGWPLQKQQLPEQGSTTGITVKSLQLKMA